MPSSEDCAYLAGLIDGEGSLTITEHERSDRPGYKRRNIRVQIYNTNRPLLESIQAQFGGVIYTARRSPKWKDQFALVWAEAAIVPVITAARPYLRLKQNQADALLEYQAMKLPAKAGRRNGHSAVSEARMVSLRDDVRRWNARGKNAIENAQTS